MLKTKHTHRAQRYKRTLLATCIAASLPTAYAQEAGDSSGIEVIQVRGIKYSQADSINTKRFADSVVDGISAEDIGKLPDVTISDSLQRISGVQIRRTAGEGGQVNIRGLPQVSTTLNGEQFLTANSIFSVQPDFRDIPSSLFAGADVYKSSTASLLEGGISGSIDLKTRRPFDLDEGYTFAFAAEGTRGSETGGTNPSLNGLFGWNNDRMGLIVAASYSDATLLDAQTRPVSTQAWADDTMVPFDVNGDGTIDDGELAPLDLDGDGNLDETFLLPTRIEARNRQVDRERFGFNSSFQLKISDAWTMTSDIFYTDMGEEETYQGVEIRNNAGNQPAAGVYGNLIGVRDTGASASGVDLPGNFQTISGATFTDPLTHSMFTQAFVRDMDSTNANIKFDYDNGGNLTGSFRYIYGEANWERYRDSIDHEYWVRDSLTTDYPNDGIDGNVLRNPNPAQTTLEPVVHWGESPSVENLWVASEPANVAMKTAWGDLQEAEGEVSALRADGNYAFDEGFVTSIDFGVRSGQRDVTYNESLLVSPFTRTADTDRAPAPLDADGNPLWENGDEVTYWARWRAADVNHPADGRTLMPYRTLEDVANAGFPIVSGTDLPLSGATGFLSVDPSVFINDREKFHTWWGDGVSASYAKNPGNSYRVKLDTLSAYAQVNFSGELGDMLYTGNLGARVVKTDLSIYQNITDGSASTELSPTGAGFAGIPQRIVGVQHTERSITDVLPSLNIALQATSDIIVRFAYSQTMAPLDLNQWGGGRNISIGNGYPDELTNPVPNNGLGATSANQGGNPDLNMWDSTNTDVSVEWYANPTTLASIGFFYMDIASFVGSDTIIDRTIADGDGVVRGRPVPLTTPVQGDGATIKGVEVGLKHGFDYLPGFWGDFGVDANYTYSPSTSGTDEATQEDLPFVDSSKNQANLVLWFENEEGLQGRIAYNYRSERNAGERGNNQTTRLYQKAVSYVDASVSYDITDYSTVYLNISNLTDEQEDYYYSFEDNYGGTRLFERRATLGARFRF
ncbi:TonB-dependent receptor [Aestuariibacter sp. A3R04]|uniref:TonB-dependent receptor n=1 Tax=Aestuariibacter sp. A3R04 TaxID=2841571 RepID=UPI001C0A5238|nr:TonB-dependent receptor [Aestuariibacter sp. A3R04]MBU3023727.1 TonB-dependent receptor [Aestuariibacter sp. A3R04]